MTGLTSGEEEEEVVVVVVVVHLTKVVPFLVEDELMGLGTGQTTASSTSAGQAFLELRLGP
ncbi:MAG: hypothetical protein WCC18_07005 [Candidatus Acidiferrales bacterium]